MVATRCAPFFSFEGDRLVCERDYFDSLTIMSRLGLSEPVSGAA